MIKYYMSKGTNDMQIGFIYKSDKEVINGYIELMEWDEDEYSVECSIDGVIEIREHVYDTMVNEFESDDTDINLIKFIINNELKGA